MSQANKQVAGLNNIIHYKRVQNSRDESTNGALMKVISIKVEPKKEEEEFKIKLSEFPTISGKKTRRVDLVPILIQKTAADIVKAAAKNVMELADNVSNIKIKTKSIIIIRDGEPSISVKIKTLPIDPIVSSPNGYKRLQDSRLAKIFKNSKPDLSLDIWIKANYVNLSSTFKHFKGILSWMDFIELAYRTTSIVGSNGTPLVSDDDYDKIWYNEGIDPNYYNNIYDEDLDEDEQHDYGDYITNLS